jgi:hypothetical protein
MLDAVLVGPEQPAHEACRQQASNTARSPWPRVSLVRTRSVLDLTTFLDHEHRYAIQEEDSTKSSQASASVPAVEY